MDDEVHTTLAFVHTMADGDRDFSFYRNPGADMMLAVDDVQKERIEESRVFHFGTLSSTHEGCREATRYAIRCAKEAGVLISFDPNLREPLWADLEDAKREIAYGLGQADIVKISDNEVVFMTGEEDYEKAAQILREHYQIPLLFVTLGRDGSRAYYKDIRVEAAGFIQEHTIETTGAGDTFTGCVLSKILEIGGIEDLTEEQLAEMLTFANAGASLITTRRGALKVMPEKQEIIAFLAEK
jgi:fructokinase